MKKIALTSLLSVFAVSGAYAANAIDGNPLYMPKAGAFYSETTVGSHSEFTENWGLQEEFGYGVTDKLAVVLNTSLIEQESFDAYGWSDLTLGAAYRVFDQKGFKIDAIGAWTMNGLYYAVDNDLIDDSWFMDKRLTTYGWTVGARGGSTMGNLTLAGHVMFNYTGAEAFDWADEGAHTWTLGLDAQYVLDSNWNLVAGVEYEGTTDDGAKNAGEWDGYFGVNYNIDATKYIGAYVNASMNHQGGATRDEWEVEDGFGYGVKFGIQF